MKWWSNRKQSQDLQISIMYIPPTSSGVVLPLLNHAGEECHPSFRSVALLAVNQLLVMQMNSLPLLKSPMLWIPSSWMTKNISRSSHSTLAGLWNFTVVEFGFAH